jgi:hypothetical protein
VWAEQRAARAQRAAEQRLEREVRRQAKEQAARGRAQARRAAAARAEFTAAGRLRAAPTRLGWTSVIPPGR